MRAPVAIINYYAGMKHFILFLVLASACTPSNDGSVDTSDTDIADDTDTDDTETDETDTDDTDTDDTDTDDTDTAPPPVIVEEGTWSLASPTLVSDSCNVDNYQDVTKFVPTEIKITNSSEASFQIDAGIICTRNDLRYTCTDQDVSESALAGTAELQINSVMSGQIIDESNVDINFDVVIESCKGVGCIAIEAVLKFPCPVELTTNGSPK